MRRNTVASIALVAAATLTGCQGGEPRSLTDGSVPRALELMRDLTVPAGSARAYFQGGAQVAAVDRYEPYCELETTELSDGNLRLVPDLFQVTRVMRRRVSDENTGAPAGIDLFGSSDIFHETHMWLGSDRQPEARLLICRSWSQNVGQGGYLVVREMQAIVGPTLRMR
jgi:hypothetical protein